LQEICLCFECFGLVAIFEFSREIYGHYININFLHKLRDEQRFDSFGELKAQIVRDAEQAKAFFAAVVVS